MAQMFLKSPFTKKMSLLVDYMLNLNYKPGTPNQVPSCNQNYLLRKIGQYTAIIPSLQTTCYQKFYHPKPPCNHLECSGSTMEWALAAQQKGEAATPFKNNPVYQKPSSKTMQINILLCAIRADHFKRLA